MLVLWQGTAVIIKTSDQRRPSSTVCNDGVALIPRVLHRYRVDLALQGLLVELELGILREIGQLLFCRCEIRSSGAKV